MASFVLAKIKPLSRRYKLDAIKWILLLFAAVFMPAATAENITLLANGDLSAWKYYKFKGILPTQYETKYDNALGAKALFAYGDKSASGYYLQYKQKRINFNQTPWLHFQWRIDKMASGFDERQKTGDDFALRIYFGASNGLNYRSLALVKSQQPPGQTWKSPYAKWFNDLRLHAVIGGDAKFGKWQTTSVNIKQLWRELFKTEGDNIKIVGLMSDSDSTGIIVNTRYGAIILSDSPTPPF